MLWWSVLFCFVLFYFNFFVTSCRRQTQGEQFYCTFSQIADIHQQGELEMTCLIVPHTHIPLILENSVSRGGIFKIMQVRIVKYSDAISNRTSSSVSLERATPRDGSTDDNNIQGSDSTCFRVTLECHHSNHHSCHTWRWKKNSIQCCNCNASIHYIPSPVLSLDMWVLGFLLLMVAII